MAKIKMTDKFDNLLLEIKARNSSVTEIEQIPIAQLVRGRFQPRKFFNEDAIADLAQSIRENGILQPILVKRQDDKYEVIAGERRWQAAKKIGLTVIPAIIKKVDDEVAATFALIENLQRADLSPLEEAEGYKQLIEKFEFTHEEIAKRVGRARSSITNALRLLNLNQDVLQEVQQGHLGIGHARALAGLNAKEQGRVAKELVERNLNVRDTENLVQSIKQNSFIKIKNSEEIIDLEFRLKKFANKVKIQQISSDRIKIGMEFWALSEIEWIIKQLEKAKKE